MTNTCNYCSTDFHTSFCPVCNPPRRIVETQRNQRSDCNFDVSGEYCDMLCLYCEEMKSPIDLNEVEKDLNEIGLNVTFTEDFELKVEGQLVETTKSPIVETKRDPISQEISEGKTQPYYEGVFDEAETKCKHGETKICLLCHFETCEVYKKHNQCACLLQPKDCGCDEPWCLICNPKGENTRPKCNYCKSEGAVQAVMCSTCENKLLGGDL